MLREATRGHAHAAVLSACRRAAVPYLASTFTWILGFACLVMGSDAGAPPSCTICTSLGCAAPADLCDPTDSQGCKDKTFDSACAELDGSVASIGEMVFKSSSITDADIFVQYVGSPALEVAKMAFKKGPTTLHLEYS